MIACDASSSSSSSSSLEKYDVFLSFRGEDTRDKFMSHLRAALDQKKIKTYIDEMSLQRGDEISPALLEAIQKSRISLIVFSKNYASSSWCLSELVHILECHRENKQMVIPIFYEVDPSHIRKQEGSYGEAFLKHEARFNDRVDIVQKWRAALTESANLSGWDSRVIRAESELVEAIVEDVLRKLNHARSSNNDFERFIGIEKQIDEIKSLLSVRSPKVRLVGIWGMGGIGKTTLAQVIYNQLSSQFEACCFVANVREESEKGSLINLRDKLLAELLKEKNLYVGTPSLGQSFVKERLQRTKALIVLDDVSHVQQLESLIGDRDQFSCESRIIITTRDSKVLRDIPEVRQHKVEHLDFNKALQLFNLITFRGNSPDMDYMELSKEVVRRAGGIPLAITVLASHLRSLRSQSKESWEAALDKLKVFPHSDIQNVLRISYGGLDDTEKDIFLDIACFFKGNSRDFVEKILNACGFFAKEGIDDLIDKSLITIAYDGGLWMHDLLQEMGQKVVHQESKELGERSRLWSAEDACHVLQNNEGTAKIQAIFLDLSKIDEEIHLEPTIFRNMHNLRLLKIYNSDDVGERRSFYFLGNKDSNRRFLLDFRNNKGYLQDLQCLPCSLRYLEWHKYPLKYLPSNFKPKNLVELKMPYSQLEQLWDGVQDLNKLRGIDLRHSNHLTQIPNLSRAPNLERINLESCISLLQVPLHVLQNLNKLITVNLSHCYKLQSVSNEIVAASLRSPTLRGFFGLNALPPITKSRSLVTLDLSRTRIRSLPSSIDSLNNLSKLSLNNCWSLANLPSNINTLDSLKYLELGGCHTLETFPKLPLTIVEVDIHWTAIKEVASSSIEGRFCLKYINLSNCKRLESLPTNIFKLSSLFELDLHGCSNLRNIPEISEPLKQLQHLHLNGTGIKELPLSIGHLISVKQLNLENCENLKSVPSMLFNMDSLRTLNLSYCPKLYFPTLVSFLCRDLTNLDLSNSNIIEIPTSIKDLSQLARLSVDNCENLRSIPELPLSLKALRASGCTSLVVVSNPKRAVTQEFWDFVHDIERKSDVEYSMFYDCFRLDQKQLDDIIIEFQLRVLRKATQIPGKLRQLLRYSVGSCFPGNEIPKWFEYQSKGSSIDIKLPQQWHNSNFLGFLVCVVGHSYSDIELCSNLSCEINLKANQVENHEFTCRFTDLEVRKVSFPIASNLGNVFMWYLLEEYHECCGAVEASFQFSPTLEWNYVRRQPKESDFIFKANNSISVTKTSKFEVKNCGIHMLRRTDLEELRFNININDQHQLKESDAIPERPESSACRTIDFDPDEPHPERIKFLKFL